MAPVWTFLIGVIFGWCIGYGMLILHHGEPRKPDTKALRELRKSREKR